MPIQRGCSRKDIKNRWRRSTRMLPGKMPCSLRVAVTWREGCVCFYVTALYTDAVLFAEIHHEMRRDDSCCLFLAGERRRRQRDSEQRTHLQRTAYPCTHAPLAGLQPRDCEQIFILFFPSGTVSRRETRANRQTVFPFPPENNLLWNTRHRVDSV